MTSFADEKACGKIPLQEFLGYSCGRGGAYSLINAIGGVLLVFGIAVSPAENNEKEETDEKQDKGEEKTKL